MRSYFKITKVISLTLIVMMLCGCAKRIACDVNDNSSELENFPPKQCFLDGCTLVPDFNFKKCCDKHDIRYWKGGTVQQRRFADQEFRQCIAQVNQIWLADVYYIGVRLGGVSFLPTPWRWGFGWHYPNFKRLEPIKD